MKLSTNLDIVNGLSTCRDMFEAKAYLKANNIAISDQELELLQSQYSKINSERTLTIRHLNYVAGGMKLAFKAKSDPGSPKLNRFTMRALLNAGRIQRFTICHIHFLFFFYLHSWDISFLFLGFLFYLFSPCFAMPF